MHLLRYFSPDGEAAGDAAAVGHTLTEEKILILVGMFFSTLLFGFLPRGMTTPERLNDPRWRAAISVLSCFSGGVFVGACLLDLFPDVRESVDRVLDQIEQQYHTTVDYPVAEFVIVLGFFLVLLVEQVVLEFGLGGGARGRQRQETASEADPLLGGSGDDASGDHGRQRASHGTFGQHATSSPAGDSDESSPEVAFRRGAGDSDYASDAHVDHSHVDHSHQEQHDHHHAVLDHSSLRSYLLLLALTFHSVFEGLAIGLAQVSGQLFSIFAAVIIHKSIMAFSLGLTMAQSTRISLRNFAASMLIFSLASPLGMAVGIGLSDLQESLCRDVLNGALQGVAGGTFLYITFFEVLPAELNAESKSQYNRMLKFFFVILGYSCICGVLFFTH